jgi:pimeloyl-ACP methyl ester carboxylesterase
LYEIEYHTPEMVGRDKDLDQLKELLQDAINGKGGIALVSGEAGIGKTRLVKEFEVYARSLEAKVLNGRCLYESPTPFLPFREALRDVFQVSKSDSLSVQQRKIKKIVTTSAPHSEEAIPLVGQILAGATVAYPAYKDEGRGRQVELETLFERDKALEAISNLLVCISEKQPLLLFIDDLHSADTPSLSLLYYLARNVQNSRILVVGTYRPEEVARTHEGTTHPLLDIIQRMSREGLFRKIELERLTQVSCFDLIRSMLGVSLDDLAELIFEETEGNPFFAIETLKLLMQQNVLIKEDACWKLSKDIEAVEIPPRVYDVVVHRISALSDEEKDILDCASVVGEEFSSGIIENVSGLGRIKLLKILNSIERRYHLVHSLEDGYQFDHSKIREVLYNEMAPELRKEYHSMIARLVEEANKDRLEEVVNKLAYHFYKSGNAQKGIPYLLKAGEDASEKWAVFEAVRFYSQTLEMMGKDRRWDKEKAKVLERLGDVYALTAQHEKANDCYEKGIAKAGNDVTRDRMGRKIRAKRILEKNGVKLAYYVYGKGKPTLVFVTAWIWAAEFWLPQVNYFSQNFRMITVDMRGTGESDKPADNYTLDLYVEDLNSIIEELREENIVLIGECIGASIAIKYFAKYPEKVSKLVLVSGSPKFIATEDFPHGFSPHEAEQQFAALEESYSIWLRGFFELIFPELGTEYLKEWGFRMSQKTPKEIASNSLKNVFEADLRPLLKKINVSTLIINGENDGAVRIEGAKYMHENIQESRMYTFDGIGHFPSITAAEKFNRMLKEFITTETLIVSKPEPITFEVPEAVLSETTKAFTPPTTICEKAEIPEGFEHAVIEAKLASSEDVTVGDEVEVRLDLVNVAKNFGLLIRVDDLIPKVFKVIESPPQYSIEDGSIDLRGKRLEPMQVESIKLSLQATNMGVINLNPKVTYTDDLGKFRTSKPEPFTITVHPKLTFEFRTKAAQNIFDYLINAFEDDYMRRKFLVQKSGWRSKGQIIKNARVSSSSVYGRKGRRSTVSELERRGLIETRIFPGERGRGGKIAKARICYEKEIMKRYVDHRVAKNG